MPALLTEPGTRNQDQLSPNKEKNLLKMKKNRCPAPLLKIIHLPHNSNEPEAKSFKS
jgi:hypothetical protein